MKFVTLLSFLFFGALSFAFGEGDRAKTQDLLNSDSTVLQDLKTLFSTKISEEWNRKIEDNEIPDTLSQKVQELALQTQRLKEEAKKVNPRDLFTRYRPFILNTLTKVYPPLVAQLLLTVAEEQFANLSTNQIVAFLDTPQEITTFVLKASRIVRNFGPEVILGIFNLLLEKLLEVMKGL